MFPIKLGKYTALFQIALPLIESKKKIKKRKNRDKSGLSFLGDICSQCVI